MEQLRKFKVGFRLLNEQGGGLIHTEFNRTGRIEAYMYVDYEMPPCQYNTSPSASPVNNLTKNNSNSSRSEVIMLSI